MLRARFVVPFALVAISLISQSAFSATKLRAILTNGGETPATVPTSSNGGPRPASYGVAIFELNDAQTAMTMLATIHNIDFGGQTPGELNDNVTNAHIHASDPAVPPPPGTRPVVWGFLGSPDNDVNPNDLVVSPFSNSAGALVFSKWDAPEGNGTNTLTNNLFRLLNERAYLNFHSTQFAGGEIRGTITVIPEPATLTLLAAAVSLLLMPRRKR